MLENVNLFLTIFLAWQATGASSDSVGAKPFFSEAQYQNCYMFDNSKAIDACLDLVESKDRKHCEQKAYEFADKHKQPPEKCVKMNRDKYNKHYAYVEAKFYTGTDWPIIYVCGIGKRKCKCLLADNSCLTED